MKKDLDYMFRELKDDIASFAELKFELLKLNTYERISKVFAILSYGLLLSVLALMTLLFAMLALGFLLSQWLDSPTIGFGIVAILYLMLVGLVVLYKNRIRLNVMNIIISALVSSDKKKKADSEEVVSAENHDDASKPDENE